MLASTDSATPMAEAALSEDDFTMTLADGRQLGYCELGDPEGLPLLLFHGTPGSRKVFSPDDALSQIPGLRLILPDRPGYGLSTPKPNRTLLDWADDVGELADHLGLDRFAILGISGGGPHALACAYAIPDRLTATLVLVSPSPTSFPGATRGQTFGNRLGGWLGRNTPALGRWLTNTQRSTFQKDPDGYIQVVARQMAPPDQKILEDEAARKVLADDFGEAFRQGGDATFEDGLLTVNASDWGFALDEIPVPVHLWHGAEDILVTVAMGEFLAQEIPQAQARIVPGAGHLITEVPEVVAEIREVLGL